MSSFDLLEVDRFIVGAVGMPGDRTFFFQVHAGKTLISFKAEKAQIAALAEHLQHLLADVAATDTSHVEWSTLDLPVFPEWDVGAIGLGYEATSDSVLIVLNELDRTGGAGLEIGAESSMESARFRLTRPQADAFVKHSLSLVSAGRPTCTFCSAPIDPEGYNCACFN